MPDPHPYPAPVWQPRSQCHTCGRGGVTCYCAEIRPFDPGFTLVLLVHPREARNRVGTVRIAHLSVRGSRLLVGTGEQIDLDHRAEAFLDRERYFPVVLFPGETALQVESLTKRPASSEAEAFARRISEGKRLVVFVIDGTWSQAVGMVRSSRLLASLPQLSFTVDRESEYRFRKQPAEYCLSTVEAVHTLIDRLSDAGISPAPTGRAHDRMLEIFRKLVRFQMESERAGRAAVECLEGPPG